MENLYPVGSAVVAITNPSRSLTIRRYASRIYYCTDPANPQEKDKVYYERELLPYKGGSLKS